MSLNILEALSKATPEQGVKRCKLAAFLEAIPEGEAGRAELIAAVDDPTTWVASRLSATFSALGHPISPSAIQDHRGSRCRCYR